jgi:hypothetical protein
LLISGFDGQNSLDAHALRAHRGDENQRSRGGTPTPPYVHISLVPYLAV